MTNLMTIERIEKIFVQIIKTFFTFYLLPYVIRRRCHQKIFYLEYVPILIQQITWEGYLIFENS